MLKGWLNKLASIFGSNTSTNIPDEGDDWEDCLFINEEAQDEYDEEANKPPEGITVGFVMKPGEIKPFVFLQDKQNIEPILFDLFCDLADSKVGSLLINHLTHEYIAGHPEDIQAIDRTMRRLKEYFIQGAQDEDIVDPMEVFSNEE